jgi:hypothetical protein
MRVSADGRRYDAFWRDAKHRVMRDAHAVVTLPKLVA